MNKILSVKDITTNTNSQYGLTFELQNLLSSQNTQFIINLSKQLKFSSYSVPSLALQISAIFFHKKGYLHFDRFLVLGACFLLASKLKSIQCKFKMLCHSFYIVTSNLSHNAEPFNEQKMKKLKDHLSIYEAEILRTLEFQIEGVTGQDFIRRECELLYGEEKELGKKIYNTTRIIILDSYRTVCCLLFEPLVVFVACFLIANRYEGKYPHQSKALRTMARDELSDEKLYEFWLKQVGSKQNSMISAQEVRECLRMVNSVLIY